MASLLGKSALFSKHRASSQMQQGFPLPSRRGFHVDLGEREKALLAEDPVLKNFKSYKPTVRRIRKFGDALTLVVAAACTYEIVQHIVVKKDH